jgi:hypothetical protein
MLLVNSDEALIPLMTDPRELEGLVIWGARFVPPSQCGSYLSMDSPCCLYSRLHAMTCSINSRNGSTILDVLARSKNLPSLVKIAPREDAATTSN